MLNVNDSPLYKELYRKIEIELSENKSDRVYKSNDYNTWIRNVRNRIGNSNRISVLLTSDSFNTKEGFHLVLENVKLRPSKFIEGRLETNNGRLTIYPPNNTNEYNTRIDTICQNDPFGFSELYVTILLDVIKNQHHLLI